MRFISLERSFDQAEFDDTARRAAQGLERLGVQEGDAVGLLMVNEIEFLVLTEALALLGAYPVPIGWHNTADEVGFVVRDAELRVLVCHDVLARTAVAAVPPDVVLVVVPLPGPTAEAMRMEPPAADVDREHVAWEPWLADQLPWAGEPRAARPAIVYTSGTTGKPKGVVREAHLTSEAREQQARMVSRVWGAEPGMRTLLMAPLYHSAPAAYVRAAMALNRDQGELHLMPRFDAEGALRTIERAQITSIWAVPTMFVKLLQLPPEVRRRYDVSSLSNVVHSGAPCPVQVKLDMIEWFGPVINEFYGSTEVGPITYATSADYQARPGTVGRVLDGCRVAIVGDGGALLPPGTTGEVAAVNSTYARFTYRNRDSERDELDFEDLVLTGDVGLLDEDGYLFLKDRKKDMVISGGVNLYPAEIEDVLLQLANVRDGAAFGIPDEVFGERMVAAVALVEAEPDAPARIERELRERLSPTKVPKRIFIVEEFPRTAAGKVAKHLLRAAVG